MDQFTEAVKCFLDENNDTLMTIFSSRLKPYRIETCYFRIGDMTISKPMLMLEELPAE
jgi:hypothetical protein